MLSNRTPQDALAVIFNESQSAFVKGDAGAVMDLFPDNSIDTVITSPPYWGLREYSESDSQAAIGLEDSFEEYLLKIANVFSKVKDVLTPGGSLWLNVGDKYHNKQLMGMPWRIAIRLQEQGWILRNEVIWNQSKGSTSGKDRLRMNRESIFHFVKQAKYFYGWQDILVEPTKKPSIKDGKVISATGVSGKKYRQQILESKCLNRTERENAIRALDDTLEAIKNGELVDFRMTIRGQQRVLHGNSAKLSGRAKELAEKGFYIIKSKSEGYMPNDIWNIVPEDEWRTDSHCAVFPVELLDLPIKATCPAGGVILDPFVGTGSTVIAGLMYGRRAIGIDISSEYLDVAETRLRDIQTKLGQVQPASDVVEEPFQGDILI
jgi:DNA modification methylase